MIEIRNRLKGKAMVVIDERDQTQLVKKIGEEDVSEVPETRTVAKEIQVGKQVCLPAIPSSHLDLPAHSRQLPRRGGRHHHSLPGSQRRFGREPRQQSCNHDRLPSGEFSRPVI